MTITTKIAALALGLSAASQAKPLQFSFESPDSLNASALRAWWFPRKDSERRSPQHVSSVLRDPSAALAGNWSAKLSFVLDGKPFPSAGIGFQFPEGGSVDLREMTTLRIKLRCDKPRNLRVSLGSRITAYSAANDTGVNLGVDIKAKDSLLDLSLPIERFAYPAWTTQEPAASRNEILSLVTAIQITIGGSSEENANAGWIKIDDIVLEGIDDEPPTPPEGDCSGNGTVLSDFATAPAKRNLYGGWWYAYTDSTSDDPLARGSSLFKDASANWGISGWEPDQTHHNAPAAFHLVRGGPYSGYGALETQFQPTAGDFRSLAGLHSIRFGLTVPEDFPDSLVTLGFHIKKAGPEYRNGRDHQVRLPAPVGKSRWCLSLDSLEQPDWVGLWKTPFTPDSLLTVSWQVRLNAAASVAHASFTLDSVMLYTTSSQGIAKGQVRGGLNWSRHGSQVRLQRTSLESAELTVLDLSGRVLEQHRWPAGERTILLAPSHSVRILHARSASGSFAQILPASLP